MVVRRAGGLEELPFDAVGLAGMSGRPVERGVEAGAAVELGGIASGGVPIDCCRRHAVVQAATVTVLLQPAPQAWPLPQQRFVRDFRRVVIRGDKTPSDQGLQHPLLGAILVDANRAIVVAELRERYTPTHVLGTLTGFGEAQQQEPARVLFVGCELRIHVLREADNGSAHTPSVVVARVGEHAAGAAYPGFQQRGGHQRKRARLAGRVGRDGVREAGFERQRRATRGFLDRGVDLGVGHRSDG